MYFYLRRGRRELEGGGEKILRERDVRTEMEMEMEKEIPWCTTVRTYMLDVDNV